MSAKTAQAAHFDLPAPKPRKATAES